MSATWGNSENIYSLRVLPLVTQTRLFGPPKGCRSHCLVRDSGAQPECLERRSCSCATSPLELHVVALAADRAGPRIIECRVPRWGRGAKDGHAPVEGQPRRLQQQFQILEDAPRLARHRTVLALAALRVDRHHAGAEDHPPGPDRRARVIALFPTKIEAGNRGRYDLAHASSRRWPRSEFIAARSADKTAHADRGRSNWHRIPAHAAAVTWRVGAVRPRRRRALVAGPRATLATRRRDQPS